MHECVVGISHCVEKNNSDARNAPWWSQECLYNELQSHLLNSAVMQF